MGQSPLYLSPDHKQFDSVDCLVAYDSSPEAGNLRSSLDIIHLGLFSVS